MFAAISAGELLTLKAGSGQTFPSRRLSNWIVRESSFSWPWKYTNNGENARTHLQAKHMRGACGLLRGLANYVGWRDAAPDGELVPASASVGERSVVKQKVVVTPVMNCQDLF